MSRKVPLAVAGRTPPAGADPQDATLAADALALVLSWDDGGKCREVRLQDATASPLDDTSLRGDGWLDVVHADHRDRATATVRAVLESEGPREEVIRLGGRGGRWAVLRAEPRTSGATGVIAEATRWFSAAARRAHLLERINALRHPDDIVRAMLDDAVELLDGDGGVLYTLSEDDELVLAGASGTPDALRARIGRLPRSSPLPVAEVMRTGQPVVASSAADRKRRYPQLDALEVGPGMTFAAVPLRNAAGRPFGALGVGFLDERPLAADDQQALEDVAAHGALALDRARVAAAAERDQERLQFLDRLSAALSSTLQLEGALTQLAGMTVPRIADWCVVRLAESTAQPRPVIGAAHVDEAQVEPLRRLTEQIPRDLEQAGALGEALRAGRPLIHGVRAAQLLRPLFTDDDSRRAMDAVGVDGLAIFPLQARGRLLGAIGFGNRPGRTFGSDELELAQSVAERGAVIVDNARLFDEQSAVARALQDSLLPGSLPEIPGIELGARYRAAGRGLDVGGDFYDAFQADANWWIFAVGDVCGHGVEAAATTGLVRHTIRSSAMAGVMPSAILGRLNEMLLRQTAERVGGEDAGSPLSPQFCTVLVGAAKPTPRGVDLVVCCGGHPLPLVGRAVGRVEPVGVPGTLLGVTEDVSLTDTVVHLDPGEALVCYTDGLIDRRDGKRVFGEEGVVKALYQGRRMAATELAELIESEAVTFVDDEPTDDMAVLALRASP
jgi:serine phosphatase RsbU (regulator of sigma subunit)